jgi:hypothetical protein
MNPSPLTLKNPKGWFAAGTEVAQALMILSDAAFKLYIYLCLNARRDTGIVHSTQTDLAKNLKKSQGTIRKCLREMEAAGICQCHFGHSPCVQGIVEITDPYWPYQRGEARVATDASDTFVAEVMRMLEARACVRRSFSTADEVLARQWHARGLPLERIGQAILLGCARKYSSWRNNQTHAPISSLRFFEPLLEEVGQQKISPDYWDYLLPRIERIEKLWIESHRPRNQATDMPLSTGIEDGEKDQRSQQAETI